jgi:hypothetical protein
MAESGWPIADSDWTNIAKFSSFKEAQAAQISLLAAGVPAEVLGADGKALPDEDLSERYIWIPAELTDEATFVLAKPTISDEELTKLALQSPPPDDA